MTGPVSTTHPAARARGSHLVDLARAVVPLLDGIAGPHRSVALATLAVRGSQGRTREDFAAAYGIGIPDLESLEDGRVPLGEIPGPLLVLTQIPQVHADLELAQPGSAA